MKNGLQVVPKFRMKEIIRRLRLEFPENRCSLNFSNTFELLVATILSAQCTDERVNIVTEKLFRKYKTSKDYANAELVDFQRDIRSTGFYRNKAKNIVGMAKMIVENYGGFVPDRMEDLLKLPGVARKTANVVLGVGFGKNDGIVVDTHVTRLACRLGFTSNSNAVKIEKDLILVLDRRDWTEFSLLMIAHGRKTCKAKKPRCMECELVDLCPSAEKFLNS